MLLRVVFSFGLVCGLAAASDQQLGSLLSSTPKTLRDCTQKALQNALDASRQKRIAKENELKGGINLGLLLNSSQPHVVASVMPLKAPSDACAIPLTQERVSPGTRFELNTIPTHGPLDSGIQHPHGPTCRN